MLRLVLPLVALVTLCQADCGENWPLSFEDNCYYLATDGKSFDEAHEDCENRGGVLTSVHSSDENAFLAGKASEAGVRVWHGFNDREIEGSFVWTDNTAVDYTNWKSGEPNNAGGKEDCTYIITHPESWLGLWNDTPCDDKPGYICKKAEGCHPVPDFSCDGKPNGDYANGDCCEFFWSCSNGIAYKMQCYTDLVFNEETDQCDYPSNVVGCN